MSKDKAQRVVGIDLGTTHTVVAWTDIGDDCEPKLFPVKQLVAAGELAEKVLLPSCLYTPLESEAPADPWGDAPWVIGEHARRRGGEVPSRSVTSAKSWLSYAAVDRSAPILPWQAEPDDKELPRISPVEASTRLLAHVRRCWDDAWPDYPLAEQEVILTVPASFDAVARQLTVEASVAAGLEVRLLEEPQAAFYDWMRRAAGELAAVVPEGAASGTVLVCDVGGGTTDLSLIRVTPKPAARRGKGKAKAKSKAKRRIDAASVDVQRIAVGRHLLLGGDNMDLALAHLCEGRLCQPGQRLDPRRFAQLVAACRDAKERLLADDAPEELPITLLGSGARLIGGALKTRLTAAEVSQVVLDGFFPKVALDAPRAALRAGIVAFGLPYERDVAVTRHVAGFLRRHVEGDQPIAAVLLNGGVFGAATIVDRLLATVSSWWETEPGCLPLSEPLAAVAKGAVAYGLALRGLSIRIGGGSAEGYYLGLGRSADDSRKISAVCVLPRAAEEGARQRAEGRVFELIVGQPVRFDLYGRRDVSDRPGTIVTIDEERHERLPPLVATLETGEEPVAEAEPPGQRAKQRRVDEPAGRIIRVAVEAELTAVGTLDLSCIELVPAEEQDGAAEPRRFALHFEVRAPAAAEAGRGEGRALPRDDVRARYGKRFEQAHEACARIYGKGRPDVSPKEAKGLVRSLEKILGKRDKWPLDLNRALFDALWPMRRSRRRGPDHERQFWSVAGFCLRPGIGDPRDVTRVPALFKLFQQRLSFPKELRCWQQFWIAWRRVAAGLDEKSQLALRDVVDPFMAPREAKLKRNKGFRNEAAFEMLDLAASLERIPAPRRSRLGDWVLEQTWTSKDPRLWAALGRIGARAPAYASVHNVVPPRTIERWLDHLLRERWDEIPTAARAAVSMCRVVDDRARDVSQHLRDRVAARLTGLDVPDWFGRAIRELVPMGEHERAQFYGEDLPVGIRLAPEQSD